MQLPHLLGRVAGLLFQILVPAEESALFVEDIEDSRQAVDDLFVQAAFSPYRLLGFHADLFLPFLVEPREVNPVCRQRRIFERTGCGCFELSGSGFTLRTDSMPTRKRKTSRHARRRSIGRTSASRNTCRALVPLDQEPLRREALAGCRQVKRKLEKEEAKWKRFQEEDRPGFERWYDHLFGKLVAEVRLEESRVWQKADLVEEVEFEFHFRGGTYRAAYRRVMDRREQAEREEPDEGASDGDDPAGEREASEEDSFKDFFRNVFGLDEDEVEGMYEQYCRDRADDSSGPDTCHPAGPASAENRSLSARVKERFRLLARRLHPDHCDAVDARKTALWHEAQEAYQNADLERLDTLLAICEVEEDRLTEMTGISLIDKVRDRFQESLRTLRARLRQARRDPAWNFSRRKDRENLEVRIRSDLEATLRAHREERRDLERLIAEWEQSPGLHRAAAARKKAKRASRKQSANREDSRQSEFSFA